MIDSDQIKAEFYNHFSSEPEYFSRAPGRVNLIGEHTDYNGGLVLPATINREVAGACKLRNDSVLSVYSFDYNTEVEVDLNEEFEKDSENSWVNYLLGVLLEYRKRGFQTPGMDLVIQGDVPMGAGLSSSAALEVCFATLLNIILDAGMNGEAIALLSQSAENGPLVGMQCGIMDQFISAMGQKDHALFIDCHTLDHELMPFDSTKAEVIIINSMKQRGLVDSEYNRRREECHEALESIRELSGENYPTLRHIPPDVFFRYRKDLSLNAYKRLRHNVTENQRVKNFCTALEQRNYKYAGELLYQSHQSLKVDFEVSCNELDMIVEITKNLDGVYGCRMTGAGFGGCAVALVKPENSSNFKKGMKEQYRQRCGIEPEIYISHPVNGAETFSLENNSK